MDDFHAVPVSAERWRDFERLFGPQGACYGCWCTYFRILTRERKFMDADARKAFMQARIAAGPAPGILCYLDDVPVGWVQVCPRAELPQWNGDRTVSRPLDPADAEDPAVWAISCFFTSARFRGRGLSHLMLAHAVAFARESGARVLEACPIERAKQSKSVGLFVGPSRIFIEAGFAEVARRKDGRPLMRLVLSAG